KIVREVPSASNSQTTRVAFVFGDKNVELWDHILDVQKDVLQGDMWERMSGVMEGAKNGDGTIIFFEDIKAVREMPTSATRVEVLKESNKMNVQYDTWLDITEI